MDILKQVQSVGVFFCYYCESCYNKSKKKTVSALDFLF